MKNLRLFFGATAFVLGMGGVLASSFSPLVSSFRQVYSGTSVIACQSTTQCDATSSILCKFKINPTTVVPLYSLNDVSQECGAQLTHSQNNGIVNP